MNKIDTKEFKLIESIFSPDEANGVLSNLISSKINYHKLEDFSNFVRFDRDFDHSRKRIVELNETKENLKKLIESAKEKGYRLAIKSTITIDCIE